MKRLKLLRLLCFFVSRGLAFSAGQLSIVAFIRVLMRPDFCLAPVKLARWLYGFWALAFLLLLAIYLDEYRVLRKPGDEWIRDRRFPNELVI